MLPSEAVETMKRLSLHERTGRPLGGQASLDRLAGMLGHDVRPGWTWPTMEAAKRHIGIV